MNQITQAFLAAGAKLPSQSERLWRIIKDNPRITSSRARDLAKLANSGTTSLLSQMMDRGMVIVEKEPKRMPGLRGTVTRMVNLYSVHPLMNGEYELLPAPVKAKKPAAKVVPIKEPADRWVRRAGELVAAFDESPAAVISKPEPPPVDPGINIDKLTLGQARRLYSELHQLFGGRV